MHIDGGGGWGGGGKDMKNYAYRSGRGWVLILPKPTEADNTLLDLHNFFMSREDRILSGLFHYSLKIFTSS